MHPKLLVVIVLLATVPLMAQTRSGVKPAPRLPNGQPDFSGLWPLMAIPIGRSAR